MPYTKTDWSTAKITADNFNKMQEQYIRAVEQALMIRYDINYGTEAEVVSSFPAPAKGRIIFHTFYKAFFFGNGTEWLVEPRNTFWGNRELGDFVSDGDIILDAETPGQDLIFNCNSFHLREQDNITMDFFSTTIRSLIIRSWGDIIIDGLIDELKNHGGPRYINIGGTQYDLLGGLGGAGGDGDGGGLGGSTDSALRYSGGMSGGGGGGGGTDFGCEAGDGGPVNSLPYAGTSTGTIYRHQQSGCFLQPSIVLTPGEGGLSAMYSTGSFSSGPTTTRRKYRSSGGGGGQAFSQSDVNSAPDPTFEYSNGGVLILQALGDVIINGEIKLSGGFAGTGQDGYGGRFGDTPVGFCGGGGGAGGSGGGKLLVLKRGNFVNTGTIDVSGGPGGTGGDSFDNGTLVGKAQDGQPGQDGSIDVFDI